MTNTGGILSDYIEAAMNMAEYEKFDEDGLHLDASIQAYGGRVVGCPGVVAFGSSLVSCERELRSVLEDWVFVGLKLEHELPVIGGVDLNKDVTHPAGVVRK